MSAEPGTIASTRVTGARSVSTRCASACAANASKKASSFSGSIARPAAALCPPKRCRCSEHAESAPWRSKAGSERPEPFHSRVGPGDQDDRAVEALDEARRNDPDHALVPVLAPDHVAAAALLRLGPRLDLGDRRSQDPVLDRLPVLVQQLELAGEPLRLLGVGRQQQLERGVGAPEPAGGVDPRREPEPDGRSVDGGGVDPRVLHQRLKPRPLRPGERAQPGDRERAVLVEQRHDVGDRRERDQVEIRRDIDAERLRELADDTGAAELRERIVRRARRDDRAVRQAWRQAGGGR